MNDGRLHLVTLGFKDYLLTLQVDDESASIDINEVKRLMDSFIHSGFFLMRKNSSHNVVVYHL